MEKIISQTENTKKLPNSFEIEEELSILRKYNILNSKTRLSELKPEEVNINRNILYSLREENKESK